ncbi:MAG: SMC-Scp complex subunit ScpB [Chromatiales bacterium]|nr:SMC-Scp complex subunit ScpB [Chromatiales bacterium]
MLLTQKKQLKPVLEALLMAANHPINVKEMRKLLSENGKTPDTQLLKEALTELIDECAERGIELVEVASGYRYQTRADYAPWLLKLWESKPPRYSKACLETLALIAYRQPITRSDMEQVRGISVATSTMRILEERGWIQIAGHKEVPGRPALYTTTDKFLDDFNIRSLDELPKIESSEEVTLKNPQLMLSTTDNETQSASKKNAQPNDDADLSNAEKE